jgi:hypothetical protein
MNLIETEYFLVDKKLAELGIEDGEDTKVKFTFNKSFVCAFGERLDKSGEVIKNECNLYLNNGESMVIAMGYEELKQKLSE